MSFLVVAIVAGLIGYLTRRWDVLFLGPIAGIAYLGVATVQHQNLWDTPTLVIAVTATAALTAGVALGRATRGPASRGA